MDASSAVVALIYAGTGSVMSTIRRRITGSYHSHQQSLPTFNKKQPSSSIKAGLRPYSSSPGGGGAGMHISDGSEASNSIRGECVGHIHP